MGRRGWIYYIKEILQC